MTREESAKWAALLQAQADGKRIEFQGSDLVWNVAHLCDFHIYKVTSGRWRIATDLPHKPSQAWLEKHGVELTGECRLPVIGELCVPDGHNFRESYQIPYERKHTGYDAPQEYRWILRKRPPTPRPTDEQLTAWGMDIVAGPMTWREACGKYDGEPCAFMLSQHTEWNITEMHSTPFDGSATTYILKPRQSDVQPWTIDTVPMPLVTRNKYTGILHVAVLADENGVAMHAYNAPFNVGTMTYAELLATDEQRDGSPCGVVGK